MKKKLLAAAAACALLAWVPGAVAEEGDAAGPIEEVIVTATKREESVQDVPIAVSAFAGEDLEQRGVQDLYGLQEVSPSIAVYSSNSTSNGGTLRIRGVGTTGNNPGLEAAVGTFIDGIYRSRAGLAFSDLVDLDRVEILRGPQGTLFGKNTVAGALNIITKKPQLDETTFGVGIGMGNLSSQELDLVGNVVLSPDTLAGRVSYAYRERDGYYEDIDSNEAYDNRDRHTFRGQLLWTPNDAVEVRIIGDYTARNESCCPAAFWIAGPSGAAIAALGGDLTPFEVDGDQRVGTNFRPYEDVTDWGLSADVLWVGETMNFRSVTAVRDWEVDRGQDIDFTNADVLYPQDSSETFENFSQEFQIYGESGNLSWLAGVYYYTEDLDSDEYIVFSNNGGAYVGLLFRNPDIAPLFQGDPAGRGVPGQGYDALFFSESVGWSAFTHNTWRVTPTFDVTLGLRYSSEEKDAGAIINGAAFGEAIDDPFCVPPFSVVLASLCDNASYNNKESENEVTGTLKAAWQVTDQINAYASYSRGYKAGGYNLDQEAVGFRGTDGNFVDQSRFNPETSDAFELGMKGQFMDNRVTVNSALFHTTFDDFQLNTFTGLGFTVGNVKEAVTKGVEVESFLTVGEGIFLTAGVTYADARYGDDLLPANAGIAGKRLTQSPLWQSSVSMFVDRPIPGSDARWTLNLNWAHIGEANTGSNLGPTKWRSAFNMYNAQLGISMAGGRYEAVLWGRNLGDKRVNSLVFDSVFQSGSFHTFLNPPRTFGVTLKANL